MVINADDVLPNIGDQFNVRNFDAFGISPGPAGANIEWDFSFLTTTGGTSSLDVIDPKITKEGNNYPNANLCFYQDSTFLYLLSDQDELSLYGLVVDSNNAVYSDRDEQLVFPLQMGTTNSDKFKGIANINLPNFGQLTSYRSGTTDLLVDGFGRLILPGIELDSVLRVKTISKQQDSVNFLFFFDTIVDTEIIIYQWLKAGIKSPVLTFTTITTDLQPNPQYLGNYLDIAVGVEERYQIFDGLSVYYNQSSNEVHVAINAENFGVLNCSLINSLGQEISGFSENCHPGTNHIKMGTSKLSAGMYFVKIESAGYSETAKVIISR